MIETKNNIELLKKKNNIREGDRRKKTKINIRIEGRNKE